MQLDDLIGKTPSQMTDDELNEQLHRLRTSRVVEGKLVGQTKASRKRNAAVKSLEALGLTEEQAIAELNEREAAMKGITTDDETSALKEDETIIP